MFRSDGLPPWIPSLFPDCRRLRRCCSATLWKIAAERSSWPSRPPASSVPPTGSCKERGRSECLRQFGRWSPYGDGLGDVRHLSNLSQKVGSDRLTNDNGGIACQCRMLRRRGPARSCHLL